MLLFYVFLGLKYVKKKKIGSFTSPIILLNFSSSFWRKLSLLLFGTVDEIATIVYWLPY